MPLQYTRSSFPINYPLITSCGAPSLTDKASSFSSWTLLLYFGKHYSHHLRTFKFASPFNITAQSLSVSSLYFSWGVNFLDKDAYREFHLIEKMEQLTALAIEVTLVFSICIRSCWRSGRRWPQRSPKRIKPWKYKAQGIQGIQGRNR